MRQVFIVIQTVTNGEGEVSNVIGEFDLEEDAETEVNKLNDMFSNSKFHYECMEL